VALAESDPGTGGPRPRFSEVSEVVAVAASKAGEQQFEATVDPEWTIAGKPNGGYLLAMLGRAAASLGSQPHVLAASAYYLTAPEPGPVSIDASLLRSGRTASQVRLRMSQNDQPCVEATCLIGQLDAAKPPYWARDTSESGPTSYEDCSRLIARLPDGTRVAIMDQVELRLDPDSRGFTRGEPSGRGELRGWLALPEDEPFDPASLLFAVDAFPPATFDIEFSGWVPTLELTAYVRALPARGPVRVLQRADLVDGRRVDESCYVWDSRGRLVAQGHQLAAIRLG
jgi:acyl-coenzyme A thioesterase PaaI-like protein